MSMDEYGCMDAGTDINVDVRGREGVLKLRPSPIRAKEDCAYPPFTHSTPAGEVDTLDACERNEPLGEAAGIGDPADCPVGLASNAWNRVDCLEQAAALL